MKDFTSLCLLSIDEPTTTNNVLASTYIGYGPFSDGRIIYSMYWDGKKIVALCQYINDTSVNLKVDNGAKAELWGIY